MFKSIQFFRLLPDWQPDLAKVEESLAAARFIECTPSQEKSVGWVEPRGEEHGALVESVSGHWIFKVMSENKILPGPVVREELEKRLESIEASTGRKPGKKESRDIKEEVRRDLLLKAFSKKSASYVWIDLKSKLLVIEAAAKSKSDDIITLLVNSIEGFSVTQINTAQSPAACMSRWLVNQEAPAGFTSDRDCVLKAADESKASVKYAKHALDIEEIRGHIAQGKMPTQLAMTWSDRVSFLLTDVGSLKKIEFQDVVFEDSVGSEDQHFDGDAAIVTGELSGLIPDLLNALGGEVTEGVADAGGEGQGDSQEQGEEVAA